MIFLSLVVSLLPHAGYLLYIAPVNITVAFSMSVTELLAKMQANERRILLRSLCAKG